jgi:microcystin-dependent protein
MSDAYLGEIRVFAGNYAPVDWHLCDGSLLPISQNQPLFSLIGTQFGGDGKSSFGIPDLRGRTVVGQGAGTGLTPRTMGQSGGTEEVELVESNWPAHTHDVGAVTDDATTTNPANMMYATPEQGGRLYLQAAAAGTIEAPMAPGIADLVGGGQPHENRMRSFAINYIICLRGIYPPNPNG